MLNSFLNHKTASLAKVPTTMVHLRCGPHRLLIVSEEDSCKSQQLCIAFDGLLIKLEYRAWKKYDDDDDLTRDLQKSHCTWVHNISVTVVNDGDGPCGTPLALYIILNIIGLKHTLLVPQKSQHKHKKTKVRD